MVTATIILLSSLCWSAPATLSMRERTILTQSQTKLFLGDIAEFENVPESQKKVLSEIVISNAPKDNEKRIFTRYAISELLRGPLHLYPLKTVIPNKIHVISHFNSLHPERLKQEITAHYKQKSPYNIHVDDIRVQSGQQSGIKGVKIQFKEEMPRGSFSVPVAVQTAKGAKTIWVSGVLKVFATVYVLKKSVTPGERILIDDLTTEERDITFSQDLPANEQDVLSAQAARALMAGSVLWRDNLQRERALRTGDNVKLILGQEGWQVSVSGVAQQGGYIGDTIKVLNSTTQRVTMGLIVNKGVVKVQ